MPPNRDLRLEEPRSDGRAHLVSVEAKRIKSLYNAFKNAVNRAKLPVELVQHDLRHRRTTVWLAEGKNPVHVKKALGHADLRTTMGYTHLAREHLRGLVDERRSSKRSQNCA